MGAGRPGARGAVALGPEGPAVGGRLRDALAAKGYDFVYAEYPQGHTWGNWRAHLLDALPHFFPVAREQ